MCPRLKRIVLMLCGSYLLWSCDKVSESNNAVTRLTLEQPCEIQQGCITTNEPLPVEVIFGADTRALHRFPVIVRVESQRQADSVAVAFSMKGMDMGSNRYRLNRDAKGVWKAGVMLPICISGRSDWVADIDIGSADSRYRLQVPFVLEK